MQRNKMLTALAVPKRVLFLLVIAIVPHCFHAPNSPFAVLCLHRNLQVVTCERAKPIAADTSRDKHTNAEDDTTTVDTLERFPVAAVDAPPVRSDSSQAPNVTLPFHPVAFKYAKAKHDRAGSTISYMLKAHAYCFNHGIQLMGICGHSTHTKDIKSMIKFMGLQEVLPLACPLEEKQKSHYVKRADYVHYKGEKGVTPFTSEWLAYMRRAFATPNLPRYDDHVFRIAVHVRRGDVSLCTDNANRRYLPNSHYVRLIDQVLQRYNVTREHRPYTVTIYSESTHHDGKTKTQYEGFDEFVQRNYTMCLDCGVRSTWRQFLAADVLIAAKSGFSMVPALLRLDKPGMVLTPHRFAPYLPHWDVVSEDLMRQTAAEMKAMQIERCPLNGTEVTQYDEDEHDVHFLPNDKLSICKRDRASLSSSLVLLYDDICK